MEISSEYHFRPALQIVNVNDYKFYISHGKCIAFRDPDGEMAISQNVWGNSTGMHLNWINRDKKIRIPRDAFEDILKGINV